jgi:hypothetical protein
MNFAIACNKKYTHVLVILIISVKIYIKKISFENMKTKKLVWLSRFWILTQYRFWFVYFFFERHFLFETIKGPCVEVKMVP